MPNHPFGEDGPFEVLYFLQKRNADLATLKSNRYEVGKLKTGLRALVEGAI